MSEVLRRNRRRIAVLGIVAVVLALALREVANPARPLDVPASLASTAWQVSIRQAVILEDGQLELAGSTRILDLRNIGTAQPVVQSPGT